ncbi:MAG: SLC13 family permease [Gammaproteobacteria bacterium]|nr:SLC13 family permease [Gammaproteobacteria bacterium]
MNSQPVSHTLITFGKKIKTLALIAGPVLAILVYFLLSDTALSGEARATAGIATLMAIWWMTEAIPLPATALLPIILFPLTGVMPVAEATAPYANHIIFLFLGGFLLGIAMQRWNLHKRIALNIVRLSGTGPRRLVGGFMLASALLSMWISNTATVIMLLPVASSTLLLLENESPQHSHLSIALLLGIAYAASIGGVGSLLGSPPNLVYASFMEREFGMQVTMVQWMKTGIPIVLTLLPICWLLLTRVLFRLPKRGDAALVINDELNRLGPMSRAEKMVLSVFIAAATSWVLRSQIIKWTGLAGLTDSVIAVAAGVLLFILPVQLKERRFILRWQDTRDLPWGILLLFGGGLSLAAGISSSGLDAEIAGLMSGLAGWPSLLVLLFIAGLVIFVTELSSNTATANTFIPILAAAAVGLGLNVGSVTLIVAIAASCAFMLPVATPPNAVVFSSGKISIAQMMRAGVLLNFIAVIIVTAAIEILST